MAVRTQGSERKHKLENERVAAGLAAGERIPGGALACRDADGYAVDGEDATGLRFLGVGQNLDADNRDGADGAVTGLFRCCGRHNIAAAGLAAGDEGLLAFLTDNDTIGLNSDYLIPVGNIIKVLAADEAEVEIDDDCGCCLRVEALTLGAIGAAASGIKASFALPDGRRGYLNRVTAYCVTATGTATLDVEVDGTSILDAPITLVDDTHTAGVLVTNRLDAGAKLDFIPATVADTGAIAGLVVELFYQVL
ncbi:MAG: hypothetical protein HYU66_23030 [Armatimonadetes bacterium]|nr:hypothetical protein [Armatimonadota bacterium]